MEWSSQPDARKRRSFLPAPKRSSGLSPTSPQSSTSHPLSGLPQPTSSSSHHSASSSSSTSSAYPSSSSSLAPLQPGDPRDPRDPRSHSADSKRRDKKPDNSAPVFGKGLRVGARIKIGGVKPGILRYLGTTHLAPGIFCGIELFDPDGCHDGEVNGHRYFSCSPKHGIFAPKERVCLDSSACALGRVTSDSDNSYSSTESLSERSNKAFQDYAEGELEAIDYSTLSPESSFHEALQGNREAGSRRGVGGQRSLLPPQPSKLASLSTTYDVIDIDQSADSGSEYAHRAASRDLAEAPQKRYKSALPKATRSSGIPTAPTSKLPTFSSTSSVSSSSTSRSYAKHDEQGPTLQYRGPPAPPRGEQGRDESRVPADAHAKTFTHSSASESDRESDRASPRFRIATTRSSDDSEEDSFVWDALSRGIKKQLRADSRQYLNFTFDPEEQNRSVDREDSESDSNSRDPSADRKHAARVYPPYSDPKFIKYIAKNVSDDSLGIISTDVVGDTSPREVADGGRRSLRGDELHQLRTSTPVTSRPGSGEVRTSDSYTIFREDQHASHSSDMSQDSSGLDEDGSGHLHQRHHHHHHHQHRRLSATRSISDSDLPPELIPRHSDEGTERYPPPPPMYDSHEEDERLSEGGYGNEGNKGEGTSASFGLNPSRKLDSRKCESYKGAPPRHEADVGASRSYTLASHELVEEIPCRKDSSYTVCTSQSYTIAKSDSVTSSPSRKSRKVSTGSSVNGEPPGSGDSSSSGTDPKTDSSGEKKGDTMDDSSSGPSPEVSQALEWDYDQDFDGKNPLSRQDNTMTTSASTGTSESLSDVLRDGSDNSDGLGEAEMPSMEDSDSQFEAPDNEFENIDSLEDFPIFGKDAKTLMTDSGISDYSTTKSSSSTVCGNSSDECSREDDASSLRTTRAVSSDSSQETLAAEFVPDTPGSVEEKDLPGDEDRDPGEEEEYEGEDGEGAAGGFVSRRGARVMDVRDELERERKDSIDDGNSTSPASVVSVEEVSAIQDRTLLVDEVTSGLSIVHAGERSKVKDFHSPGSDTSLSDEVPDESLDTDRSLGFDDVTVLEKSSSDLPRAGSEDTGDEDMNDESRDHTAGRKQRPVSLISTTSADTGYVPDTDSELGTLTTTSPADWVDRLGLTHPTSYAPLDDVSEPDDDVELQGADFKPPTSQPGKTSAATQPAAAPQGALEEEDYSGDFTADTEDDRIEADRVNGPRAAPQTLSGQEGRSDSQDVTEGVSSDKGELTSEGSSPRGGPGEEESGPGGKDSAEVSADANNKSRSKDSSGGGGESQANKKGKPRKQFTMTKKKMEVIDHKLPNTKVTSRLADYINTPPPAKPKEEKEKEKKEKFSKIAKNKMKKNVSETPKSKLDTGRTSFSSSTAPDGGNSRDAGGEKVGDRDEGADKTEKNQKPEKIVVEKPKPKPVKRTPPKSKWGDIMSQISTSKDTAKPKPKSEIKSSLAAYLNTPPPQAPPNTEANSVAVNNAKNEQQNQSQAHKFKSRIKPLPPPPPKIDLSKVKSKLGVPTAASAHKVVKRDSSPATHSNKAGVQISRDNSPATGKANNKKKNKKTSQSEGSVVLSRQTSISALSSARSSRTDLSLCGEGKRKEEEGKEGEEKEEGENQHKQKEEDEEEGEDGKPEAEGVSEGAPSKRGSVDQGRKDRRLSTNSIKSDHSEKSKQRDQVKEQSRGRRSQIKSTIPPFNRSRKSNVNGTAKGAPPSSAPNAPRGGPTPSSAPRGTSTTSSQKEIVRLESLCEARTKELSQARMQLRATTQAFDAMSVVVNYCCVELDAFECPTLALKLETVQRQLKDCLTQIADLTSEKDALDKNLSEISQQKEEASKLEQEARHKAQADREDHEKVQKDMEDTHNAALTAQRDELTQQHNEAVKKLHDFHDKQIDLQKQAFDRQLLDVKNENKMEINGIRISQLEEIQELRNKHDTQMEELHKQHRNKLEDITHRFESIKLTLSEKVESLRGECDDLRHRARSSEEALQRDADVKVQMALAPFLSLPKEIESLKTVVEMRNEEISKLRSRNMDLEKQLEEIPIARDKIISLQQKVENLEAIINIKTDHEKQLHEKCQILMRKYDKESRANKRLSMDYEQVMWRMSQSSEFGSSESLSKRQVSRSPARSETTSPDPRHRTLSPNYHGPNGDVVMRVKKRSSKSLCETDRKLRSRSATFVVEKDEKLVESRSPSSSPQVKQKRWKRISQGEEDASENSSDNLDAANERARMCVSAGPEILSQYTSGHLGDGDVCEESDMPSLGNTMDSNLASSGEMINSYARSISGVSDSGVYDSMTRSEMLNSSIVSTDSEWVASANVSQMLDSTNEDFDGSPDGCSEQDRTVVHNVRSYSRSRGDSDTEGSARHTYQFQVSIPGSTGEPSADNVFEDQESGSLGSCSLSLENTTDGAPSVSNSRLTSVSEDFSCHDIACDTTVSLPLGGAAQDDRTPSRDVSSDNLSGLPRSETVVEKCIGEMGGAQCNSSGEGRATQDDVHQEN